MRIFFFGVFAATATFYFLLALDLVFIAAPTVFASTQRDIVDFSPSLSSTETDRGDTTVTVQNSRICKYSLFNNWSEDDLS